MLSPHSLPLKRSDSSMNESLPSSMSRFHRHWNRWQRRIPVLKRVRETFLRIPPRMRYTFVVFWFAWKIGMAIFLFFLVTKSATAGSQAGTLHAGLLPIGGITNSSTSRTRVLYVVTTLAEYNTGGRRTIKGQDRLAEVLIPVVVDGVESMVAPPFEYEVDVFLICHYELKPEREQLIRDSLPNGVGLQVWDDAAPLGYDNRNSKNKLIPNTRSLARQHRYVIKDKFFHYDMFLAFEDDMRVTGAHVQHYMQMSTEIDRLREQAPETVDDVPEDMVDPTKMKFFGPMTRGQLERVVPGFIRVEVLLNDTTHSGQNSVLPIPMDFEFDNDGTRHIDPQICCHVNMEPNIRTPRTPPAEDVIIWESNVKAFSLRELPSGSDFLDWTVVMLGPGKKLEDNQKIGGYWSGRQGAFGDEKKPQGGPPDLIAQQGGWMATRDQIVRWNSGLCMGSFLPPYDEPSYYGDGQESMNVEFWSGSYQIFTGVKSGCNMQRLLSLHPDHFSKHLIYHVANNKQKQLSRERMVRADQLFAQLNAVQKMAKSEKEKILAKK